MADIKPPTEPFPSVIRMPVVWSESRDAILIVVAVVVIAHSPIGSWRFP